MFVDLLLFRIYLKDLLIFIIVKFFFIYFNFDIGVSSYNFNLKFFLLDDYFY